MLNKILTWVLIVAGFIVIVIGKTKGFHLTEGEAFIYLWQYWLSALLLFGSAALLLYYSRTTRTKCSVCGKKFKVDERKYWDYSKPTHKGCLK